MKVFSTTKCTNFLNYIIHGENEHTDILIVNPDEHMFCVETNYGKTVNHFNYNILSNNHSDVFTYYTENKLLISPTYRCWSANKFVVFRPRHPNQVLYLTVVSNNKPW